MDRRDGLILELLRSARKLSPNDFQSHAWEIAGSVCRFDKVTFGDGVFMIGHRTTYNSFGVHNVDPEMPTRYGAIAHCDAIADEFIRTKSQRLNAFNVQDRAAGERYVEYRKYVETFGLRNVFYAATPMDQHGRVSFVALFRDRSSDIYHQSEVELAGSVLMGIVEGRIVSSYLAHSKQTGIGDDLRFSRAITSDRGVLRWCDDRFIELLGRQWHRYRGLCLPRDLLHALIRGEHSSFFGSRVIASAIRDGDHFHIVAQENAGRFAPSERLLSIARLAASGSSVASIAGALSLRPKTIRNELTRIYEELGISGSHGEDSKRAMLLRWWLDLPEARLSSIRERAPPALQCSRR